jgi:hypothetical protein
MLQSENRKHPRKRSSPFPRKKKKIERERGRQNIMNKPFVFQYKQRKPIESKEAALQRLLYLETEKRLLSRQYRQHKQDTDAEHKALSEALVRYLPPQVISCQVRHPQQKQFLGEFLDIHPTVRKQPDTLSTQHVEKGLQQFIQWLLQNPNMLQAAHAGQLVEKAMDDCRQVRDITRKPAQPTISIRKRKLRKL